MMKVRPRDLKKPMSRSTVNNKDLNNWWITSSSRNKQERTRKDKISKANKISNRTKVIGMITTSKGRRLISKRKDKQINKNNKMERIKVMMDLVCLFLRIKIRITKITQGKNKIRGKIKMIVK
jgi:hypothetical protein